ncbi:MAG TPA: stage III sporulation protein AB [Oscillospiraceae bacterium]|nr:stage III sporulation protein AB [Oscillospiraceae bacterium]
MWIKWLGAVLILAAALMWGNLQAAKLRARVRELEEFRLALRLLAAEIGYTATPLPRALEQVGKRLGNQGVQAFLAAVRQQLQDPQTADASTAWLAAVHSVKPLLCLTPEDWAVVARASAGLGGLGRDDQLKQLAAAETQLAAQAVEAAALCASNEKMWRYLGALSGLTVVILLL